MGKYCSRIWSEKANVLILGIDGAGKTSLLYKMKQQKIIETVPTVGFNVEQVLNQGVLFTMYDAGGQEKVRQMWHHYYHQADAIVYVLDSSDSGRLRDSLIDLNVILKDQQLAEVPLLMYANKRDISESVSVELILYLIGLQALAERQWFLQESCGLNGEGVVSGLNWLSDCINDPLR